MPLVTVDIRHRNDPAKALERIAEGLARQMPGLVFGSLNISERTDARLKLGNIVVSVNPGNGKNINSRDIEVVIHANDFPELRSSLQKRADTIRQGMRRLLDSSDAGSRASGFLIIRLLPSAICEF